MGLILTRVVALKSFAAAHTSREDSVWAALGQAPLARAAGHLAELADRVGSASTATDLQTQVAWYSDEGHVIDDLALRTIATAKTAQDRSAVAHALGAIYDPWVDQSARVFQKAAVGAYRGETGLDVATGTCVVYVDALRYDWPLVLLAVCRGWRRLWSHARRLSLALRQPASRR